MARFIPVGRTDGFHNSPAERMVYEAFKKLPDDYCVFYSLLWGKDFQGRHHRGESDFMVFDPTRGFIVIEVKGGGVRRDPDGQWYSTSRNGDDHRLPRSPLLQAQKSADRFKGILDESDDVNIRNYRIVPIAWFPNIDDPAFHEKLTHEYEPSNTFTEDDLDDPEGMINYVFSYNNMHKRQLDKPAKQIIDEVVRIFAPVFRIVPSISSELKERDFLFNQLTSEQASLLDYLVEQRTAAIHGASGTGKTMIALECARGLPKDTNILFLCFNKLLIQYLKDNFGEEMPNVTFANLNQLYAKATGGDEIVEADVITDFLLDSFSDNYQFEHIIVDEAQDIKADHLDLLSSIASAVDGYFYVFYDKNQLVHQWDTETLGWLKKMDCRLVLNKNCRNTLEIAKTAYSPFGLENVILPEMISGDTPCMNNYSNTEEAIKGIAETIRFYTDKGFTKKQITILTLKTLNKTILNGLESVYGYRLTNDLDGDGILFTTARKYKGLESDVVIIIDFDGDTFKDDNAKSVFYVASSRAKHCLTFVASLSDDDMRKAIGDLGGDPTGEPRKTLKKLLNIDFQFIR